jgi:hypothetical protein
LWQARSLFDTRLMRAHLFGKSSMPHSDSSEKQLPENDSISLKLLLPYASHKTYFDNASWYPDNLSSRHEKETLGSEDLDRLYLHMAVLKSVEKNAARGIKK